MRISPRSSRRGSTLVVALFIIALLAVIIGVAFDYTNNTARMAVRGRDLTAAQSLADGAIEAVYMGWQNYMIPRQGSTFATSSTAGYTSSKEFDAVTAPILTALNAAAANSGFTVKKLTLRAVDQTDQPHNFQSKDYASTGPLQSTPGWIATADSYRALAVVVRNGSTDNDKIVVSVSRYFQQADSGLMQAMLFFQNDLELHPGPNMTLYGLVHTNANMYAVAGSGGGLTFTSNVSYAGNPPPQPASAHPTNFYQSTGDGAYLEGITQTLYNQESGNWASYKNPVFNSGGRDSQLSEVQKLDPLGLSTIAIDPTNPNDTGTHEIIERPLPTVFGTPSYITADTTKPDKIASHRLFDSAGLRILINRNTATNGGRMVHVYQPGNTSADSKEIPPSGTPLTPNITDAIIAAVTPASGSGELTDAREGHLINVDTLDVSKLVTPLGNYGSYNGVIYISDVTNAATTATADPTSIAKLGQTGDSDAIRLKNGGILPSSGMTVVSDGAVYVQGDYNTGSKYDSSGNLLPSTQPNSDLTGDPTQFTYNNYVQVPAAVIGDAVMILSNSWVDSNSNQQMVQKTGVRIASPTTVNTAIVSGQVLTDTNDNNRGSGGAHNFPRFLEDWSSKNFTYHGSMCQLYASEHFVGLYGNGGVYSPPNRLWYFDDRFVTYKQPPGNLRATNYVRGRWARNQLSGNELQ